MARYRLRNCGLRPSGRTSDRSVGRRGLRHRREIRRRQNRNVGRRSGEGALGGCEQGREARRHAGVGDIHCHGAVAGDPAAHASPAGKPPSNRRTCAQSHLRSWGEARAAGRAAIDPCRRARHLAAWTADDGDREGIARTQRENHAGVVRVTTIGRRTIQSSRAVYEQVCHRMGTLGTLARVAK
jgi:hypothetical protein